MAVMNIGADVSPAGLSAFDQAIMSAATPTAATAGSGGGFLTNLGNLGDALGGFFGGTGGALLGAGLSIDELNKITDIANRSAVGQERIGREAQEASAFKPFTVSTGFGGVQTTPEGGFTTSLSPAQAAQQQQLQAITSGLLGGMGGMGGQEILNFDPQPTQFGQLQGSSGPRPPSLEEVLSQRGFTMPERPTGYMTSDMTGLGKDPVTGNMISGSSSMRGYYNALNEMYAQNPEALEIAKQYKSDPFQFGGEKPTDRAASLGGLIGALQPAQPPQAPTAPSTGGFGTGIPDVSGITGQALGDVTGVLTGLMAPMATREADVYERIRATQRPEEQRRQLALQEQLQAQGRTGLRTAQFGGSPEQFALAQAQEEAKNRAALSALGQAQAEQQQQLGLAQGLFGLGSGAAALPASLQQGQLGNIGAALGLQYAPEQQLLSSLDPAVNLANIVGTGQRQGAGYLSSAGISGLEDILQAETVRSQNLRDIYSTL